MTLGDKVKKGKRTENVHIRLHTEELRRLKELAEEAGTTTPELIRFWIKSN